MAHAAATVEKRPLVQSGNQWMGREAACDRDI